MNDVRLAKLTNADGEFHIIKSKITTHTAGFAGSLAHIVVYVTYRRDLDFLYCLILLCLV